MKLHFVVPGDPNTATGGYLYDRRIAEGLPACGVPVRLHALPDGFPDADAETHRFADALLRSLPDASVVAVDGLAFGAMPQVARAHAQRLRLVALVHHPLSFETGLAPARARQLADSERDALACARKVIVPSRATAWALAAPGPFGVPAARIAVVEPGTDPAPLARGSPGVAADGEGAGLSLLCVATLTPRKGHLQLLDALDRVRDRRWTLRCVGSARRDPAHACAVAARVDALALADRVALDGELDRASLERRFAQADAFVLASFHEGYGMAFAEALACGLPVIGTRAGAIAQTVPADAGLLVPPGDVDALAAALARFLDDPALRRRLADGALRARAAARLARELPPLRARGARGGARVSGFDAPWLALREPFDRRARSAALEQRLARSLPPRRDLPLRIVDLGCGTGANLRHLAGRIGGAQRWCLIDNDPELIAALPAALEAWAAAHGHRFARAGGAWRVQGSGFDAEVSIEARDLARDPGALAVEGASLVTASALLDLVSDAWLEALLRRCVAARATVLFALGYDGRIAWRPPDPDDALVRDAFDAHQRTDKGFGPALGPRAASRVLQRLEALGYAVACARSDWGIGAGDAPMARALLSGWASAAAGARPDSRAVVQDWRRRREETVARAALEIEVGHLDVLGWPGTSAA